LKDLDLSQKKNPLYFCVHKIETFLGMANQILDTMTAHILINTVVQVDHHKGGPANFFSFSSYGLRRDPGMCTELLVPRRPHPIPCPSWRVITTHGRALEMTVFGPKLGPQVGIYIWSDIFVKIGPKYITYPKISLNGLFFSDLIEEKPILAKITDYIWFSQLTFLQMKCHNIFTPGFQYFTPGLFLLLLQPIPQLFCIFISSTIFFYKFLLNFSKIPGILLQ